MADQLTADTCAQLSDPANYTVLVSSPVLKVVSIAEASLRLCNFVVDRVATVSDGAVTTRVALPDTLRVWASGTGGQPTVNPNDVIKVQRMLRLPDGDTSVILVHDVEICSNDDIPLEITNYEDRIQSLQAELTTAQNALKRMLQEQHEVAPALVESVMKLLIDLNAMVEEVIS